MRNCIIIFLLFTIFVLLKYNDIYILASFEEFFHSLNSFFLETVSSISRKLSI